MYIFSDFEEGSEDENAYEVGKVRGRDDSDEDDYELDEGKKLNLGLVGPAS